MEKLLAIGRNTFTQTIRQPIYGILIMVTMGVLVLSLPLTGWTMGTGGGDYQQTDQKMMENLGLSTLLMAGLFLAAFSASSALSREIEDKTALTVIAKPVGRWMFVAGKFLGLAAAVGLAFYLCCLVFLMTVRHQVMPAAADPFDFPVIVLGLTALGLTLLTALGGNYLFGWPFTSAAVWTGTIFLSLAMGLIGFIGKGWHLVQFGKDIPPDLLKAIVLDFMGVLVFVAAAVTASTRLGQVMTILVCVGVLMVGSIHPLLSNWKYLPAVQVLAWIAPNFTYFYSINTLSQPTATEIPWSFLALSGAYCLVYVAGVLALGVALFQRRELAAEAGSGSLPGAVSLLAGLGRMAVIMLAIAAAIAFSMPQTYNLYGLLAAAALLAIAVASWLLWGFFARGAKWSYWVTLLLTLGALADAAYTLAASMKSTRGAAPPLSPVLLIGGLFALVVLIVLIMPKTRRHFSSTSNRD